MDKKQLVGLMGSIVLLVGVFTPIVSMPIIGSMNYFQYRKSEGIIITMFAVISFILTLAKKYRGLWFTGLAALGVVALTFFNLQMEMSKADSQMGSESTGSLFEGLVNLAMWSIRLQWGWATLIVGAMLVITAAAIRGDTKNEQSN